MSEEYDEIEDIFREDIENAHAKGRIHFTEIHALEWENKLQQMLQEKREHKGKEGERMSENFHGRMMNIPMSAQSLGDMSLAAAYARGHRDARHAAAEIALEADARIAELEAQLAKLQQALAAKTDWTSKVGERAAKLASRIAANDYEVQAMEALANELAAAQERERDTLTRIREMYELPNSDQAILRQVMRAIDAALAAAQPASDGGENAA